MQDSKKIKLRLLHFDKVHFGHSNLALAKMIEMKIESFWVRLGLPEIASFASPVELDQAKWLF